MKKTIINIIKILFIISPIIIFCIDFCATFWGVNYELDVNQTNIAVIEENLQRDNLEIENLKDISKIEISGAGLNDYSILSIYYNDNSIKSINLYLNEKNYSIEQYLNKHHKFNWNDMTKISTFISLATIVVTIYSRRKISGQ